jgi:hypothetical protein
MGDVVASSLLIFFYDLQLTARSLRSLDAENAKFFPFLLRGQKGKIGNSFSFLLSQQKREFFSPHPLRLCGEIVIE